MTDKTLEALERIQALVKRRTGARGLDPDLIYGMDGGIEVGGADLRLSDLNTLLSVASAALAAPVDAAGAPKPEATVLERAAIQALNAVKAWRDSDGNEPFPHDARMLIDAVLAMGEQRRTALATHTHNPIPPLDEPMLNGLTEAETTATASVMGLSTERRDVSPQADALGYATRLATAIHAKHYSTVAPQWKPLSDLMGVLTQINNMTSGLARPPAVEAEPVRRLVDAAMAVISRHDEWARQMPAGAFDDPLSVSLAALHDAAETVGISLDIVRGYAAPLQQPQEGWVSVPREPTEAMVQAGVNALPGTAKFRWIVQDVYAFMIAAAPSQGEGEG